MNELQIFNYEQNEVRTCLVNGEPWFVASDVCRVLDLGNTAQAIARLDDDEKGVISNDTLGGRQEMTSVNEPGLYSLVLGSRKPEAKAFKRWITHEVIPAIRKHGGYLTADKIEEALLNPDTIIRLATDLKAEREKAKALSDKIEADKPKVLFAEAVSTSHTSILIGDLAKILKQNGIEIGQKRMFGWLREHGYLIKSGSSKNIPTQRAMEQGLFEIKEGSYVDGMGNNITTRTSKVTGKGQIYFVNKFMEAAS